VGVNKRNRKQGEERHRWTRATKPASARRTTPSSSEDNNQKHQKNGHKPAYSGSPGETPEQLEHNSEPKKLATGPKRGYEPAPPFHPTTTCRSIRVQNKKTSSFNKKTNKTMGRRLPPTVRRQKRRRNNIDSKRHQISKTPHQRWGKSEARGTEQTKKLRSKRSNDIQNAKASSENSAKRKTTSGNQADT
jgi:hypothetical protein